MAKEFKLVGGRWTKGKSPVSELFYSIDFAAEMAARNTSLESIVSTTAQGVEILVPAVIQGAKVVVKLGGLDSSDGAENFCRFLVLCVNGEKFDATMWFVRELG